MLRYAIVIACLFVAACGSDEDEPSPPAAQPPATALTVTIWPEGRDGPSRKRHVECPGQEVCRELSVAKLAPLPGDTPCTAIYGGPDQARVRGTIDGERVDFEFSREDGCQINRWDENVALLGKPSGRL